MKFSVVTISFNQARFLEEAIISVLSQKGVDVEYIVVDPGSTDGSRNIIERYRSDISRIIFEEDEGPADGLNRGFSYATGDVLYFLNADDTVLSGAFASAANCFHADPQLDVLLGSGEKIFGDGRVLDIIRPTRFNTWLYLHGGVTLFQQGAFFRRAIFERVGGFNKYNFTCWDGELFLAMADAGATFRTTMTRFGRFRIHDESISGSGRLNEKYRDDIDRLYRERYGDVSPFWRSANQVNARMVKPLLSPIAFASRCFDRCSAVFEGHE